MDSKFSYIKLMQDKRLMKEKYYQLDWSEIDDRVRLIVNEMKNELNQKYNKIEEIYKMTELVNEKLEQEMQELH